MSMVEYRVATKEDMELLMGSRLEMLREVNDLPDAYVFGDGFAMSKEHMGLKL